MFEGWGRITGDQLWEGERGEEGESKSSKNEEYGEVTLYRGE